MKWLVWCDGRPLYLVTTAELTQRGSWKSTFRLVLLLTDRETTLGASGGPGETEDQREGRVNKQSTHKNTQQSDYCNGIFYMFWSVHSALTQFERVWYAVKLCMMVKSKHLKAAQLHLYPIIFTNRYKLNTSMSQILTVDITAQTLTFNLCFIIFTCIHTCPSNYMSNVELKGGKRSFLHQNAHWCGYKGGVSAFWRGGRVSCLPLSVSRNAYNKLKQEYRRVMFVHTHTCHIVVCSASQCGSH